MPLDEMEAGVATGLRYQSSINRGVGMGHAHGNPGREYARRDDG